MHDKRDDKGFSEFEAVTPRTEIVKERLILAPLHGFTDVTFRNVYHRHFGGIDEAVAPFVPTGRGRRMNPSHLFDLEPCNNDSGVPVVPQILSNNPDDFIRLADTLFQMGFCEINWNLGCPFPMVANKMRGAGLLPYPDIIDQMLENIQKKISGRLSIKTRLGRFSADEIKQLIPIFNRYPLQRVIVHPRTGVQMYTGQVDLSSFELCLKEIRHPVVYNGDINGIDIYDTLSKRFPDTSGWMIGRGVLANVFLPEWIKDGRPKSHDGRNRFYRFHRDLVDGYLRRFSGPTHVLDRMKGFWGYFALQMTDRRRILKKIRKANTLAIYNDAVSYAMERPKHWPSVFFES